MNLLWRIGCAAITLVLWAPVLWLALELTAVSAQWWEQKHNPYIKASIANEPFPTVAPSTEPRPIVVSSPNVQWSDFQRPPSCASWETPNPNETEQEREQRRALFPSLSAPERRLFCLVNRELVREFDYESRLQQSYGDPMRAELMGNFGIAVDWNRSDPGANLHDLPSKVSTCIHGGQPMISSIAAPAISNMEDKVHWVPVTTYFYPARELGRVFAFLPLEDKLVQVDTRNFDLPTDSRWEIPCFRLKKNEVFQSVSD